MHGGRLCNDIGWLLSPKQGLHLNVNTAFGNIKFLKAFVGITWGKKIVCFLEFEGQV